MQDGKARGRVPKAGRKEVTTRMPPELAELVRHVARGRGLTVNDFIVEAVEAEVARERGEDWGSPDEIAQARARARQILLAAVDDILPRPVEVAQAS